MPFANQGTLKMRKSYRLNEAMESQRSRGTSIASATSGRYGAIEQNIDDDQDRSLGIDLGRNPWTENGSVLPDIKDQLGPWISRSGWIILNQ